MSGRDNFEDDGRTIADMSALESAGLFRRRSHSSRNTNESVSNRENKERPWEDAPFSWKERLHYMGVALLAALSIAFILLAGMAFIIWLLTLYA